MAAVTLCPSIPTVIDVNYPAIQKPHVTDKLLRTEIIYPFLVHCDWPKNPCDVGEHTMGPVYKGWLSALC
jgi:hypothetical protein